MQGRRALTTPRTSSSPAWSSRAAGEKARGQGEKGEHDKCAQRARTIKHTKNTRSCKGPKTHLEHAQQRLAGLQDLHVGRLRLLDGLIELQARLHLARQALVQLAQPLRDGGEVPLALCLLLLVAQDGAVDLLALLAQVLNAAHQLLVVPAQRGALCGHGRSSEKEQNAANL